MSQLTVNASAVDAADSTSKPVAYAFANLDPTTGAVQHISYTVGPFGRAAADAAAAAAAPKAESAAAQDARREAHAAAAAAQKQSMLSELLDHFDVDSSGALGYQQFVLFFKSIDSSAVLIEAEFEELCQSLDMTAATGITDLAPFFPDSGDVETVRKLHARVLGLPIEHDPFAQLEPSASTAASGGGRKRDWRQKQVAPEPEPEMDLEPGIGGHSSPTLVEFEVLDQAILRAQRQGKAVLICDPSERASQFLSYQSTEVVDAKGLFVLDKLHKRPRHETLTDARRSLLSALRLGKWLHFELGKSAPNFGEWHDPAQFPVVELFAPGFGSRRGVHATLVPVEERWTAAEFWGEYFAAGSRMVLPGSWSDGHGLIITTFFRPEDYRELLTNSWPGWPWDDISQIIVAPPRSGA